MLQLDDGTFPHADSNMLTKKNGSKMWVEHSSYGIEDTIHTLDSANDKSKSSTIVEYSEANSYGKKIRLQTNGRRFIRQRSNTFENLRPSISGCTLRGDKRDRRIGMKKYSRKLKCYKIFTRMLFNAMCENFSKKFVQLLNINSPKRNIILGKRYSEGKITKRHGHEVKNRNKVSQYLKNDVEANSLHEINSNFIECIENNEISDTRNCGNRMINKTSIDLSEPIGTSSVEISEEIFTEKCPDPYEFYDDDNPLEEEAYRISGIAVREENRIVGFSIKTDELAEAELENGKKGSLTVSQKSCIKKIGKLNRRKIQTQEIDDSVLGSSQKAGEKFATSLSKLNRDKAEDKKVMKVNKESAEKHLIYNKTKNSNNSTSNVEKNLESGRRTSGEIEKGFAVTNMGKVSSFNKKKTKKKNKKEKKMVKNEEELAENYLLYSNGINNSNKSIPNVVKDLGIWRQTSEGMKKGFDETKTKNLFPIEKKKTIKKCRYSPLELEYSKVARSKSDGMNHDANEYEKKAANKVNKLSMSNLTEPEYGANNKINDYNFVENENSGLSSKFMLFSSYSIPVSIEIKRISKKLRRRLTSKKLIQTKITTYFPLQINDILIGCKNVTEKSSNHPRIEATIDINDDHRNETNNVIIKEDNSNLNKSKSVSRQLPIIQSDILLKNPKKLRYPKNNKALKTAQKMSKIRDQSDTQICTRHDIIEDSNSSTKITIIPSSYSIFSNDENSKQILDLNVDLMDSQQVEDLLAPWETVDILEKVNRWHEDTFEP